MELILTTGMQKKQLNRSENGPWARALIQILFLKWSTLVLAPFVLSGCISLLQPVGDWARPSDLGLDEQSLTGVKVGVRTGLLTKTGEVKERPLKVRSTLVLALQSLGAEVIGANQGPGPDLTLWYLEQGVGDSHSSMTSEIGFLLTGGILPWISSREVAGELRVTDQRGVLLGQQATKLVDVQAFGWLALIHVFNRSETSRQRRRAIAASFRRSVQNLVYSQSVRVRLAKGGPR